MVLAVWLITSLTGLAISLYGLREARRDSSAMAGIRNGRRLVARQRLFAQTVRSLAFGAWVGVGIAALSTQPGPPASPVAIILIFTNIAWTAISASDVYVGWRLRNPNASLWKALSTRFPWAD